MWKRILRWCLSIAVFIALGACASGPALERHGFLFNFIVDSPEAELLDYRYGNSFYGAAANATAGKTKQSFGVSGEIRRGDDLYVKWRLKATGEILEDTVDLRSRLPQDITGSNIYFAVRDRQLFVFLITREARRKGDPVTDFRYLTSNHVIALYPDNPKQ